MSVTFGYSSPGQIVQNLDTVLTLAFANSGNQMIDAISKNNAFYYEMKKSESYEGVDAPEPYLEVPLMYGLGSVDWYEGWDTLGTQPTEGITGAVYEWRQMASPVGYNRREERLTHPAKIKSLVKAKMEQAQLTITEGFNKAFLQGSVNQSGGTLYTPFTGNNGRSAIDPIGKHIFFKAATLAPPTKPSDSLVVGGLDQATYDWWRNYSVDLHTITTYKQLLYYFDLMMTYCGRGPGGMPKLIIMDEISRALLNQAYYDQFRRYMETDNDYPFENLKFKGARIITDELVPDVYSGTDNCATYGTAYFINPTFFKVKYDKATNFILTDLQKPINQDGKIGHTLWMGNTVVTNRRKNGVAGGIPRSLS